MNDMKMLNDMIKQSTNVKLYEHDWYSYSNQKRYTYLLAREILLADGDITPEGAILEAQEFHNAFYRIVMK